MIPLIAEKIILFFKSEEDLAISVTKKADGMAKIIQSAPFNAWSIWSVSVKY